MPASEVSFASAYDEEVGAFSPPSCAGENLTCQLLIVRASKGILIWEEAMTKLTGFGTFAALPDEQLSEKISRRILSGSLRDGRMVEHRGRCPCRAAQSRQ
jgi:hypothetical protein